MPIRAHEARLAPRRFTIVVHAREAKDGILLNVSRSPELFEQARSGKELSSTFQPGTGMAEDAVIRHRTLYLGGPMAHHYLIHDAGVSRYHRVEQRGARYRCQRDVDALELVEEKRVLRLGQVDPLYLVFFLGTQEGVERRREALKLRFDR